MNSFAYNTKGDDLLKAAESILKGSLQEADDFYSEEMIKNQLQTIVRNSSECMDMIERGLKFPEWAQSKIAVSEDGIVSVAEFMQSHYANKGKLDEVHKVGFPLTKKAIKAVMDLDHDEFEEFLGGMADYFHEFDPQEDEFISARMATQIAIHFEQAYKIWKNR
jgi:hypothetical protein